MTLVQLQYVLAVAEYKNFTLAAEKSFVTQPTLSMQIQKLENELNIEIFDRSTHPIQITAIGQLIINQAKEILKESKRMQFIVDEQRTNLSGIYKIGIIPTILPNLVPLFYKTFEKKFPKSELQIIELTTQEILKGLKESKIDFGIAAIPLNEEHIFETPLYDEPLVAYIPKNHSLGKKKKIDIKDIPSKDMLLLQQGHCFRNNVLSICNQSQIKERNTNIECSSFNALMKMADEGYGITLLPSLFTEDVIEERKAYIKGFSEPVPTRQVGLLYHKSQLRQTFVQEFTDLIKNILRGVLYLEGDSNPTKPTIKIV